MWNFFYQKILFKKFDTFWNFRKNTFILQTHPQRELIPINDLMRSQTTHTHNFLSFK